MKCDELKAEQWLDYSGEPNRCYPANKVDEAIAELKDKVKFCSDFELAARKDIKEMRGQHQMLKQFGHYNLSPVPGKMINNEVRQYVSYNVVCMIINHLESENKRLKAENERLKKALQHSEDELESYFIFEREIKQELRATSRALWLARAYRAEAQWNRLLRDADICFAVGRSKEWDILNQKQKKWQNVERLCRAKAEEYK